MSLLPAALSFPAQLDPGSPCSQPQATEPKCQPLDSHCLSNISHKPIFQEQKQRLRRTGPVGDAGPQEPGSPGPPPPVAEDPPVSVGCLTQGFTHMGVSGKGSGRPWSPYCPHRWAVIGEDEKGYGVWSLARDSCSPG